MNITKIVYKCQSRTGVITIKTAIILTVVLSTTAVMLHLLIGHYLSNQLYRRQKVKLESALANYDTYLYSFYGLYGLSAIENEGDFSSDAGSFKSSSDIMTGMDTLDNSEAIRSEIVEYMRFRMPINYMDQLLSRLDIIKSAENTKHAFDIKSAFDALTGQMESLLDQKIYYTLEINGFSPFEWQLSLERLLDELVDLHQLDTLLTGRSYDLKEQIRGLEKLINQLEAQLIDRPGDEDLQEKLQESEQSMRRLKDEWDGVKSQLDTMNRQKKVLVSKYELTFAELDALEVAHAKLIGILERLAKMENLLEDGYAETRKRLEKTSCIGEVRNKLLEELDDQMEKVRSYFIAEDGKTILNQVMANRALLLEVSAQKRKIGKDTWRFNIPEMLGYINTFDDFEKERQKVVDPAKQATYDQYEKTAKADYKADVAGKTISKALYVETGNDSPDFWLLVNIKKKLASMFEEVSINEYLLSTFMCFAEPSASDYDFFNKYDRASYFNRGEIEYILHGQASESINVFRTLRDLYIVRTVMNTIHVYLDEDKLLLSQNIGTSVAGWTGVGAALVTNILRVGWAAGESALDMKDLLKGENVPLLKLYPEEWHLDLGLLVPEGNRESIAVSYHDYMRLFLLVIDSEIKLRRTQHLISINLYKAGRTYSLSRYYSRLKIMTSLTNPFMSDEYELEEGYE